MSIPGCENPHLTSNLWFDKESKDAFRQNKCDARSLICNDIVNLAVGGTETLIHGGQSDSISFNPITGVVSFQDFRSLKFTFFSVTMPTIQPGRSAGGVVGSVSIDPVPFTAGSWVDYAVTTSDHRGFAEGSSVWQVQEVTYGP